MINNLIILEGPDGAGKTALIEQIKRRVSPVYVTDHGPYPELDVLGPEYFLPMTRVLRQPGTLLLMDRCWLSEPIYGAVHRGGKNRVPPAYRRLLERTALTLGAVVVLCLPPVEACLATFRARRGAEYLDSEEKLQRVHELYSALDTPLPVVRYDYTSGESAGSLLARANEAQLPRARVGAGVWSPRSTLLIGEQSNARNPKSVVAQLPFTSFNKSGCGAWLGDQLEESGVSEARLAWVNALTLAGEPQDLSFTSAVRFKRVIALGNKAARRCRESFIEHTCVTHPQHHKRFHFNEPYKLTQLLQENSA